MDGLANRHAVACRHVTGQSGGPFCVRRRASLTLARKKTANLVAKARTVTAVAIAEPQSGSGVGCVKTRVVNDHTATVGTLPQTACDSIS